MKALRIARLTLVAGAIALAGLSTSSQRLSAEECGGPGDILCSETEACVGWFWGRICTTTYDYYQAYCKYCHVPH